MQVNKLLKFVLSVPEVGHIGASNVSILARNMVGVLLNRGVDLYSSNDAPLAAYIVVSGAITLYEEGPPSSGGGECGCLSYGLLSSPLSSPLWNVRSATAVTISLRLPAARLPSPCQRTSTVPAFRARLSCKGSGCAAACCGWGCSAAPACG